MEPNQSSRLNRRQEKKQDRFLNWAIGIVAVLILIVGGFLLMSIHKSPSDNKTGSYIPKDSQQKSSQSKESSVSNNSNDSSSTNTNNSGSSQSTSTGDSSNQSNTTTDPTSTEQTSSDSSNTALSGPWQPIGTTQQEPHHKSYKKGSTDWKEMRKALAYATGIKDSNMTVWWLGNGGGPDLSLGKVSKKGDPNKKYEVHLKWVTNKGWMPTSVTLLNSNS